MDSLGRIFHNVTKLCVNCAKQLPVSPSSGAFPAHSEIMQAVGRARLVTSVCEVHVFAKLPVSGSVLAK